MEFLAANLARIRVLRLYFTDAAQLHALCAPAPPPCFLRNVRQPLARRRHGPSTYGPPTRPVWRLRRRAGAAPPAEDGLRVGRQRHRAASKSCARVSRPAEIRLTDGLESRGRARRLSRNAGKIRPRTTSAPRPGPPVAFYSSLTEGSRISTIGGVAYTDQDGHDTMSLPLGWAAMLECVDPPQSTGETTSLREERHLGERFKGDTSWQLLGEKP
ncbi:hypothetical protein FA95DRAFT_1564411 [Auriscalpium vulgare]|uniref:Uncharacterized protein n=1 Tax=Auriscalpium vulgare TaxID=40419 RepID=A0ACB8RFF2_9AGAM|nr:hypothetical protein FA95DRAFT_1564411 [Auriscalpium vulgare]